MEEFGAMLLIGLGHSQSPYDDGVMMLANARARKRLRRT
jgi:hypothetical protein